MESNDFKGTFQEETNLETDRRFGNHLFFIVIFHESLRDGLRGYPPYSECLQTAQRHADMPLTLGLLIGLSIDAEPDHSDLRALLWSTYSPSGRNLTLKNSRKKPIFFCYTTYLVAI